MSERPLIIRDFSSSPPPPSYRSLRSTNLLAPPPYNSIEIDLTGKYFFLSNCTESLIILDGIQYYSPEAAYQSTKTINQTIKYLLSMDIDPFQAYQMGRSIKPFPGWKKHRLRNMLAVVKTKFDTYQNAREKLILTYPKKIIARNDWGDTYWGVCRGTGKNFLGKILMYLRKRYIDSASIDEFFEVV